MRWPAVWRNLEQLDAEVGGKDYHRATGKQFLWN
jgi:lysyl-tRNA synthetase class I